MYCNLSRMTVWGLYWKRNPKVKIFRFVYEYDKWLSLYRIHFFSKLRGTTRRDRGRRSRRRRGTWSAWTPPQMRTSQVGKGARDMISLYTSDEDKSGRKRRRETWSAWTHFYTRIGQGGKEESSAWTHPYVRINEVGIGGDGHDQLGFVLVWGYIRVGRRKETWSPYHSRMIKGHVQFKNTSSTKDKTS
jgi:hypothetical protein